MTLKLKLNLTLSGLLLVLLLLWTAAGVRATRDSVREEITASNRVALQMLRPMMRTAGAYGIEGLQATLGALGRVRANEIELRADDGRVLYRSPPPVYKAGRSAPAWYAALVTPPLAAQELEVPGGRVILSPDPSRSVLDGWDELVAQLPWLALGFVAINAVAWLLIGAALRPLPQVVAALGRIEGGDLAVRLPPLPGRELSAIGVAFNRMAQSVADGLRAQQRAQAAERRAGESQDLAHAVARHVEEERRLIARELHDQLGQTVTAIRSLAMGIAQRPQVEAPAREAAELIEREAARLYDAMRGVIPRLAPLDLEQLGLADALATLVAESRERFPRVRFALVQQGLPELGASATLAFYRAAQEAITNAVRHGEPASIAISARQAGGRIELAVDDDGRGLPSDWQQPGRFGLRGLRERFEALGGALRIEPRAGGGVRLLATLPHLATETVA